MESKKTHNDQGSQTEADAISYVEAVSSYRLQVLSKEYEIQQDELDRVKIEHRIKMN